MSPAIQTILLLFCSNLFMTVAWYGHLKFKSAPLLVAIGVSWLIALPEYAIQVPANRIGHNGSLSAFQLKILQEAITLVVFMGFAWFALGEAPKWNHLLSFILILSAVAVGFYNR